MVKSSDGGVSWSKPVAISLLVDIIPVANTAFRVNSFPAAAIDPTTGTLYAVWASMRPGDGGAELEGCSRQEIVLGHSFRQFICPLSHRNSKAQPSRDQTGTVLVTALLFAHHTNLCAVRSLLPSEAPCFAVLRGTRRKPKSSVLSRVIQCILSPTVAIWAPSNS